MPQKTVKGDDGRDYIELPGGIRFPADDLKEKQPSLGGGIATQAYKLLNPEVVGGVAGLMAPETGGLSLAIPSLVGAGTSVARDLYSGERDPRTIASDAAVHAGTNMIPGIVGRGVKAGMSMGSGALDAMGMLPKVGIVAKLAKMMGAGADGGAAAAKPASDLTGATLPFGEKVLSQEGLDYLVKMEQQLASKGKAFGDAQFDHLDKLIQQVRAHLEAGPQGQSLAQKAFIPIETEAARAATKASKYGSRVTNGLRGALGLGSTGYEEAK